MFNKLLIKTLKTPFAITAFIGLLGFIGGGLIIGQKMINYNKELPLSLVTSAQFDQYGNIYLCLEYYGYIQKYSPDGEYIKNWPIQSSNGGISNIQCVNDSIFAYPMRGFLEIFDLDGNLLKIEAEASIPSRKRFNQMKNQYGICQTKGFFNKCVLCKHHNSSELTIIKMSFINKLLRAPQPAWLMGLIGLMGFTFLNSMLPGDKKQ